MMGFGSKVGKTKSLPHVGFGTWMDPSQTEGAVSTALECGYRHIDCSPLYKNEKNVGNVIKRLLDAGNVKRSDLFVCTKLPPDCHARQNVSKALTKSLNDLQSLTDATMNKTAKLAKISLRETWEAMEGLVKNIGISNFTVECHVFLPQNHVIDFCNQHNIIVVASSPLENPQLACEVCDVKEIATKHKVSPAQVLLRWNLQRGLCVIPKSVDSEKIRDNCRLYDFDLGDDDMRSLNALGKEYTLRTNDPVHIWGIPIFD